VHQVAHPRAVLPTAVARVSEIDRRTETADPDKVKKVPSSPQIRRFSEPGNDFGRNTPRTRPAIHNPRSPWRGPVLGTSANPVSWGHRRFAYANHRDLLVGETRRGKGAWPSR
jgi:hypothetical protein